MAITKLKLKVIPSDEAKAIAADILAGKAVDPSVIQKANASMGLKIEMEADGDTISRVVSLIENDLGGKPLRNQKA